MSIISKLLIFMVRIYQKTISPLLGATCCFYPSCSNYMIAALTKHGAFYGLYLGIKRLLRCHPGSDCAIDEVP